jgi:hypothetical protein
VYSHPFFLYFGIATEPVVRSGFASAGSEDGEGCVMVLVLLSDTG